MKINVTVIKHKLISHLKTPLLKTHHTKKKKKRVNKIFIRKCSVEGYKQIFVGASVLKCPPMDSLRANAALIIATAAEA